jgi:GR25 family glycosyltransferase involved in LPS biosynthesis
MNSNIKIYWINLDKDEERKERMINQFKNLNLESIRVSAISYDPPHIGCCLSHIKAIHSAFMNLTEKDEYVIFMEDDLILSEKIYELPHIINLLPSDWEVLQLHLIDPNLLSQIQDRLNQNLVCINKILKGYFMSAACYVMSKRGIKKFIDFTCDLHQFPSLNNEINEENNNEENNNEENNNEENNNEENNNDVNNYNVKVDLSHPLCKSEELIYRYLNSYTLLIPMFNTLENFNSSIENNKEYMERNYTNMNILNNIFKLNYHNSLAFDKEIITLPYDLHYINDFPLQTRLVSRIYKKEKEFLVFMNYGLGNRLFQLLSIYSLSKKYKVNFSVFYSCPNFKYPNNKEASCGYLHVFNIFNENYPSIKTTKILDVIIEPKQSVYSYLGLPINRCRYVNEKSLNDNDFNENLTYIFNGKYNNEDYFKEYRNDILPIMKEPIMVSNILNKLSDELYEKSIAIHVKSENLIDNKNTLKLNEYYQYCINEIKKNYNVNNDIENNGDKENNDTENKGNDTGLRFVIVSDEKNVKRIYKFFESLTGIPMLTTLEKDEAINLYFMIRCKGVISSGSRLSWWGAWLNKNEDKNLFYIPHNFDNNDKYIGLAKATTVILGV